MQCNISNPIKFLCTHLKRFIAFETEFALNFSTFFEMVLSSSPVCAMPMNLSITFYYLWHKIRSIKSIKNRLSYCNQLDLFVEMAVAIEMSPKTTENWRWHSLICEMLLQWTEASLCVQPFISKSIFIFHNENVKFCWDRHWVPVLTRIKSLEKSCSA